MPRLYQVIRISRWLRRATVFECETYTESLARFQHETTKYPKATLFLVVGLHSRKRGVRARRDLLSEMRAYAGVSE